jgi:hypothetical protein
MNWGEGGAAPNQSRAGTHAFDQLRHAATRFCRRGRHHCSAAQLGDNIVDLGQTIDILRREQARLAGVFSATAEWEAQGSNTDTDWLRHNGRMSWSDAAEILAVGAHLTQLPKASAALDAGEIGFGHLVHMARNAEFVARRNTGSFDEGPLLQKAVGESVSRFRHTCLNMRHIQDPAGVVADEVNAVEMRELTFNPQDDGTTFINLLIDAPTAVIIEADNARRAQRLGPDDHRSRRRRGADAMVDRLIGEGGPAAEITVSCTPDTLVGLVGAPAAELAYTDPISGEMLRRLGCNAVFTKILLDDKLIPVAASHSKRMPTRKERQAMDLQQKRCRGRGCHRPASQCSPHHVVWYARSRRTKIAEMVLLCPYHHWMAHEGGWDVALKPDGELLWIPPFARGPTVSVAA